MVSAEFAERGWPVFEISAVSRAGLRPLTFALADMVRQYREYHPQAAPKRTIIPPIATAETGFSVIHDPEEAGGFIVRCTRPERWIPQTDYHTPTALGHLATRFARLGLDPDLA